MCKLHIVFILLVMLVAKQTSRAQLLLAQDPLYAQVFVDEFDSLNHTNWSTHWPWSNVNWLNSNNCSTCGCSSSIDVACARSSAPTDTANRKFFNVGGTTYMRIISKKENTSASVTVFHYPYNATYCAAHSGNYGVDANGVAFCYYDSLIPFKFTTAMLHGNYRFKYGYFEIRYRLPEAGLIGSNTFNAYMPNFWMMYSDTSAYYSELDFFETRGTDWHMDANYHYRHTATSAAYDGVKGSSADSTHPYLTHVDSSTNLGPNNGNWYTVGCEWTPEYADFYYNSNDTMRRYSASASPAISGMCAMPLIIDVYMPAFQYCIFFDTLQTKQPFNYDIDYVKVYQVKQHCISRSFLNTSSATYADTLWQDLTIGGLGGSAVFNSNTHHLAGSDFVLLQEGFEASGSSATLIISTMGCQGGQYKGLFAPTYPDVPDPSTLNALKSYMIESPY